MNVLRIAGASFERAGLVYVAPFDALLESGAVAVHVFADARAASTAARVAAGLVKPTRGSVHILEFDPAIQPVQAKRCVAFVPADPGPPRQRSLERYFTWRAHLWGVEPKLALARARAVLEAFADRRDDPQIVALAGALIANCPLLVLDQPTFEIARAARAIGDPASAIFTTQTRAA